MIPSIGRCRILPTRGFERTPNWQFRLLAGTVAHYIRCPRRIFSRRERLAKQFAVGDTFTHVRECDTYRPIYYASASGDFNPIHLDKDVGRMAGLGGVARVAHPVGHA